MRNIDRPPYAKSGSHALFLRFGLEVFINLRAANVGQPQAAGSSVAILHLFAARAFEIVCFLCLVSVMIVTGQKIFMKKGKSRIAAYVPTW